MLFDKQNLVWTVLAILFNLNYNHAAYLRCYRGSFTVYTEVRIDSPGTLITDSNPCIDVTKSTIVLGTGFDNDADNGPAIKALIETYTFLNEDNVILLNWSTESKGIPGLGPLGYPLAIQNSKTVGENLAKAILNLISLGLSKNIHLIGHSIGAHIMGLAGRETMKQNVTIPWITGLDPARPGFETSPPYPIIGKDSGAFVDIIHSDEGGNGLNRSIGHIDIYPNFNFYLNGTDRQPFCDPSFLLADILIGGNRCSHDRSWEFYNSSLTQPTLFKIGSADNYFDWVAQNGNFADEDITYLGPAIDKTKRGVFFVSTLSEPPYGKGDMGLVGPLPEYNSILPVG